MQTDPYGRKAGGFPSLGARMQERLRPPAGEQSAWGQLNTRLASLTGRTDKTLTTYSPEVVPNASIERMETHFQLAMALFLIKAPLASTSPGIEGSDPDINEFVRAVISPHWSQLLRLSAETGVTRGCAPWEIVYSRGIVSYVVDGQDKEREGYLIAKTKDLDPYDHVQSILVDSANNFAGYGLRDGVLEPERTFHYANDMRFGEHWGRSRLAKAYDQWYRVMLLDDFCMQYMERLGNPPTKVRFPPGKDDAGNDNQSTASGIATAFTEGSTAYALLPTELDADGKVRNVWDVELLMDNQRGDMFLEQLRARLQWTIRPLLIPDKLMTQEGDVGSYALAHTHADVFLQGEEQLGHDIVDALNAQLVPRIVRYNFGPDAAVPQLVFPGLRDDVRDVTIELFKELVKYDPGVVDGKKMAEQIGLPTPEEGTATTRAPETDKEKALSLARRLVQMELADRVGHV